MPPRDAAPPRVVVPTATGTSTLSLDDDDNGSELSPCADTSETEKETLSGTSGGLKGPIHT